MQHTLKKLTELLNAPHVEDYHNEGQELVRAMASDGMSYADASYKLHCFHHIFTHAEECLSRMALDEMAKSNRRIEM